jgi:lipoprotein-releasing system permease protein
VSRFAIAAAAGVALGVAVLLVVLSVMDGFQMDMRQQLIRFHGEAALVGDGTPFPVDGALVRQLEEVEGVEEVVPFYEAFVLAEFGGRYAFPLALGIDGDAVPADGVLLGSAVAEQLEIIPGEELLLFSPRTFIGSGGETMLPLQVPAKGYVPTRRGAADGQRIMLLRQALSELCGDGDSAKGYELRLADGVDCERVVRDINSQHRNSRLGAVSWMDMNGDLVAVLAMERAAMFFSMAGIVAVAAFAMGSFLAAHVSRRARDIGILRAMGFSGCAIGASFFMQSIFIGAIGSCCGVGVGALVLRFRDALLAILVGAFGSGERLLSYYAFNNLPMHWSWFEVAKICSMALAVAAAAGLIPAIRAMGTDPSIALRHGE